MVSRRHAEFRLEGATCKIVDLNSRFGTFLDGKRILEAELKSGSRAQFGPEGPVLHVVRIEHLAAAEPPQKEERRPPIHPPTMAVPAVKAGTSSLPDPRFVVTGGQTPAFQTV